MKVFEGAFYKNTLLPASLLAATIIGAGVFSLPYVVNKAGWAVGLGYLLCSPFIFYFLHAMYADILLRSADDFKFVGFAKYYLGNLAFWLSILATILGSILTLTVYLILAESFIAIIFPAIPTLGYHMSWFWAVSSALIFINIKRMAKMEFLITAAMAVLIFLIFIFGLAKGLNKLAELPATNWSYLFLPFGPALFSFSGRTAIPALIDYYKKNNVPLNNLKKVIFWGTAAPAAVYLMFVVGIIGIAKVITEDSVVSIASLSYGAAAIIGLVGFLSLLSSYAVVGLSVRDILRDDIKFNHILANLIVIAAPILLIYAGFDNFIKVITLAGGIFLALEGMIVVAMWKKAETWGIKNFLFQNKLPSIISYAMLAVFFLGALYAAGF